MQGPFLAAIVFALVIGVIEQHKEAISSVVSSVIGVIFLGIFIIVSIVVITKGFKEFKEYRRGKKQERASIRQWNSSTPQSPRAAKDAAAYNEAIAQQELERIKKRFSPWYSQQINYINGKINNAIAHGRINDNKIEIFIDDFEKGVAGSIYNYYFYEIKKEIQKTYLHHGWKTVDITKSEGGIWVQLICD